jgi:hypothetical protein
MHSRDLVSVFLTCLLSSTLALASSTGWVAFSDPGAPFSISLPADYGRDEALIADNQHHGIHAYYFRVPERFARGTNLSPDSHLSVEVDFSGGACTPDLFQDNASGYYVETQGPITFNVSKTGDAGAGNFYEDDVYAVAGSKPCIAVRYFIHSHNIGNYDPGSVRAYDAEGLIREFDAIRRTLVIRR